MTGNFATHSVWVYDPRSSQFNTAYNKTLDQLEHELTHLRAKDVRIEAGYSLDQIRNDGWPRSRARPLHPGVVLYFESKGKSLCFPCGTYAHIEDNIRAIALTLEALRAVDRYGVTVGNEQYRGFASLPAPEEKMSVEDAAQFVANRAPSWTIQSVIENYESYRQAYRQASKLLHPDV